jgi:hypothetical protein
MIPMADVGLLLRGWRDSKRTLRVIGRLGVGDFSAFCKVLEVNDDGFSLVIGNDGLNMIGFLFDGWVFDFTDPPANADRSLPVGGRIESAIAGAKRGLTLLILLLEET